MTTANLTANQQPMHWFALRYLMMWLREERGFHQGMQAGSPDCHDSVRGGMHHFRVLRSFKGIGKDNRANLEALCRTLDQASRLTDPHDAMKAMVHGLKDIFGRTLVSASSKLLWLKRRHPFVFYDSQARAALVKLGKLAKTTQPSRNATPLDHALADYQRFVAAWRSEFKARRNEIIEATDALSDLSPFVFMWFGAKDTPTTKAAIARLAKADWFRERVFDVYLWELGGER